jgi:hypothetical protein
MPKAAANENHDSLRCENEVRLPAHFYSPAPAGDSVLAHEFTKTASVALLPLLFTAPIILERSAADTVSVLRAITPSRRAFRNA